MFPPQELQLDMRGLAEIIDSHFCTSAAISKVNKPADCSGFVPKLGPHLAIVCWIKLGNMKVKDPLAPSFTFILPQLIQRSMVRFEPAWGPHQRSQRCLLDLVHRCKGLVLRVIHLHEASQVELKLFWRA